MSISKVGGSIVQLYNGDCLDVMDNIGDKSIDMILADLPYGTTSCKWDSIIDFDLLWEQYERIIKNNGAIVLFGSQPFTSKLIISNIDLFRYEIIWQKERPTNFMLGKKQIMKYHENILVFYKKQPTYNPILEKRLEKNKRNNIPRNITSEVWDITDDDKYAERTVIGGSKDWIYPISVQEFSMERGLHPTQKPTKLLEYLIKTYTNENEVVLDNVMGSGSTGVACANTNRNFIGIELDKEYFEIAKARIENVNITLI